MMVFTFRNFYIPEYMNEGLRDYIERGVPVGSFLTAVLSNDLMEAVGRADDENIMNLPAYCAYLYNEAPPACFGSHAKMEAWLKKFADERASLAQEAPAPDAA